MFIVIEGVDGVGKSTICKLVASRLNFIYHKSPMNKMRDAKIYYEDLGDALSRYYFYRAVVQSDSVLIKEKLSTGNSIICDRYIESLYSYHLAMDPKITSIFESNYVFKADVEILLTASQKIRIERICERSNLGKEKTKMDESQGFLDVVQNIFRNRIKLQINTDHKTIEEVVNEVVQII
ncbi:AAA family ATPase, partial [Vibrio parahaemolyticus]|nr:AAA family ATPase [Vibrio parahaemolyticus]